MNQDKSSTSSLIHKFYQSFALGQPEEMVALYQDDVVFSDPVFGELKGEDAKNMWRMLLNSSKGDLMITYKVKEETEHSGSAEWTAIYTFKPTGRKVKNFIKASFEIRDHKIIRHVDDFDLWRWTQQAMGWKGYLFGWTPIMQNQIRIQTKKMLKKFSKQIDQ